MQNRREFIKRSCTLCLGLAGLGAAVQLEGCASLPVYKTAPDKGIAEVPLSSFTEKSRIVIVRNPNFEFDIVLVKKSDTSYNAFELKCTHQDNPLTATQTGFFCPSHGSAFDLDGKVTQEPAPAPLKKYTTELTSSSVLIHLKS
jgi:Rieske Fe-S protein